MVVRYYITPYNPIYWSEDEYLEKCEEPVSDLHIDFRELLMEAGKKFTVQKTGTLIVDGKPSLYFAITDERKQIMAIEIESAQNFSSFIVWYRSFVPLEEDLYLFREGSYQSLKLTIETTVEEVSNWTGLP